MEHRIGASLLNGSKHSCIKVRKKFGYSRMSETGENLFSEAKNFHKDAAVIVNLIVRPLTKHVAVKRGGAHKLVTPSKGPGGK